MCRKYNAQEEYNILYVLVTLFALSLLTLVSFVLKLFSTLYSVQVALRLSHPVFPICVRANQPHLCPSACPIPAYLWPTLVPLAYFPTCTWAPKEMFSIRSVQQQQEKKRLSGLLCYCCLHSPITIKGILFHSFSTIFIAKT